MIGLLCIFGWDEVDCFVVDFVFLVIFWGMCFIFNLGIENEMKILKIVGVLFGLLVIFDV